MDRFEELVSEWPVLLVFTVFVLGAIIVVSLSMPYYIHHWDEFSKNIIADAHGTLFSVFLVGWLLAWFSGVAERRGEELRYQEEISDFIGWQSPEAMYRLVGNIRRLNRMGIEKEFKLTEAHLCNARLNGVRLRHSDLWGADLTDADMPDADLQGSNMAGTVLVRAILERTDLTDTDLRGANLSEADLERASLQGADLRGANLTGADLQYAVVSLANMQRATLTSAGVHHADFTRSDLSHAFMEGASCVGARFDGADMRWARMRNADLSRASFVGTRLPGDPAEVREMFRYARGLESATLDPWVKEVLEETEGDPEVAESGEEDTKVKN
jgi:BTB/POZ domain-containing protein KCTD9